MSLSTKHRRFVAEYLIDLNATQAAIRAGYSPTTAKQQGARLLTNADIAAAIAAGTGRQLEKLEITADRVKEEIARIAFLDPRACFDAEGNLLPIGELPTAVAAALAQFDIVKQNITTGDGKVDVVHRLKWADKMRALELLAKHFGIAKEVVEVAGLAELVERLQRARERVK